MRIQNVNSVSAEKRINRQNSVMKRIIEWVETMFSRPEAPDVAEQTSKPVSVEDLVMPDIYADEAADTVPILRVIDLSSPDIDKSAGFNPYDTAVLRKK